MSINTFYKSEYTFSNLFHNDNSIDKYLCGMFYLILSLNRTFIICWSNKTVDGDLSIENVGEE